MALLKKEHGIEVKSASSTIEEVVAREFVSKQARQRGIKVPSNASFADTPGTHARGGTFKKPGGKPEPVKPAAPPMPAPRLIKSAKPVAPPPELAPRTNKGRKPGAPPAGRAGGAARGLRRRPPGRGRPAPGGDRAPAGRGARA